MLSVGADLEDQLREIAAAVDPQSWMLVGGLMVHLHAELAGIPALRATSDVDVVLLPQGSSYSEVAYSLSELGYTPHDSLDPKTPFHRFLRRSQVVDLMVPDDSRPVRFRGRAVLKAPGSRSATARTLTTQLGDGVYITLPDIESALSLKGAAAQTDGFFAKKHAEDGITLFACLSTREPIVSRSMRANINALIARMDEPELWLDVPAELRIRALEGVRRLRPEWVLPIGGTGRTVRPTGRRRGV
jgi:hypothetical protein